MLNPIEYSITAYFYWHGYHTLKGLGHQNVVKFHYARFQATDSVSEGQTFRFYFGSYSIAFPLFQLLYLSYQVQYFQAAFPNLASGPVTISGVLLYTRSMIYGASQAAEHVNLK